MGYGPRFKSGNGLNSSNPHAERSITLSEIDSMYQRGEITEEIGRTFRSASVTFVPEDPRVRKAAWQGEIPVPGRFAKALDELVLQLGVGARVRSGGVT